MLINKRLIHIVPESKKMITTNVFFQWTALLCNIGLMFIIASAFEALYLKQLFFYPPIPIILVTLLLILTRFFSIQTAILFSYRASQSVKTRLRRIIYEKLVLLGPGYSLHVSTSEIVQTAVEGVDQLETYFGSYLPQFFYSLIAPLTLFLVLSSVSFLSALILLLCVPLIPISIALIQTFAKKLLGQYWKKYTDLGNTFLENLQGLTTLKIYQTDSFKQQEMNKSSEAFRIITMKVLRMQLSSITVMDLIAFGGAALGIILAILSFKNGEISLSGCLLFLLLSADFFLPMRQLGSYFHIAMNGIAASERIFTLIDLPEPVRGTKYFPDRWSAIVFNNLCFSYSTQLDTLQHIDLTISRGSFTAIVGESGAGKSTIAALLNGRLQNYTGELKIGGIPLHQIKRDCLMDAITFVGPLAYLFKGTVRENLLIASPDKKEAELWKALDEVGLSGFLRTENGLDTLLFEKAANLSGGQCQRLALARALLHDSPIYVFDEATASIDVESESQIIRQIESLAQHKTVLMITHRLMNARNADTICVMSQGKIVEQGTHQQLINQNGYFKKLWHTQHPLEQWEKECTKQ